MLKQRRDEKLAQRYAVASELQHDIRAIENTFVAAMKGLSNVQAKMMERREELGLEGILGHDVLVALATANSSATAAMSQVIAAHKGSTEVARKIGLEIRGFGETEDCPPIESVRQAPLTLVANG